MKKLKLMISIILVLIWMIFIFIFSEMKGEEFSSRNKLFGEYVITTADSKKESANSKISVENTNENNIEQENNESKVENYILEKYSEPIRKIAHVIEYGILGIVVLNFIYQLKNKVNSKCLRFVVVSCFICAGIDEFHQSFIIGRNGSFRDVLTDTVGAITVCLIFVLMKSFQKNCVRNKLLLEKN